jgi:PPIC-type PPIASE domain
MSPASRFVREPLVQFLAIGAVLFMLFNWRGGGAAGGDRIVITPGQVDAMVAGFLRTWQRPPTDEEIKGLLDDWVREEIATREAMAMGLDRDDTVIRRRLRQKLEFASDDSVDATPPTDPELQAWLDAHPEALRSEPEVAFRQVYVSQERGQAAAQAEARRILERLKTAGPAAKIETLGDRIMLPREVERSSRSQIAREFGEEFAEAVSALAPGQWHGPIASGYGIHLVLVRERVESRLPPLAEVRPFVEREFTNERRTRELNAMYERLLERYRVVIEKRPADAEADEAGPTGEGAAK